MLLWLTPSPCFQLWNLPAEIKRWNIVLRCPPKPLLFLSCLVWYLPVKRLWKLPEQDDLSGCLHCERSMSHLRPNMRKSRLIVPLWCCVHQGIELLALEIWDFGLIISAVTPPASCGWAANFCGWQLIIGSQSVVRTTAESLAPELGTADTVETETLELARFLWEVALSCLERRLSEALKGCFEPS